MNDVTPKYFDAKAANSRREAEVQAFYHQTLLEPVLEGLAALTRACADIAQWGDDIHRIADAVEKLAQKEDSWLHPAPSEPPVETESPDPMDTNDEVNWLREELEKKGSLLPHEKRLFGLEEEES